MKFDDKYKSAVNNDKLSDDFIKELSSKMAEHAKARESSPIFRNEYKNVTDKDKLNDDFIKELSSKMAVRAEDIKNGTFIADKTKHFSVLEKNVTEEITTRVITHNKNRYNISKTASLVASLVIGFTVFGTIHTNNTKDKNRNNKQINHVTTVADTTYYTSQNTVISVETISTQTDIPLLTTTTAQKTETTSFQQTPLTTEKTTVSPTDEAVNETQSQTTDIIILTQTESTENIVVPETTTSVTTQSEIVTTATVTTASTTTSQTESTTTQTFPIYTVEFGLSETTGCAGDTVYINFGICKNDNNGFCSFLSELDYDKNVLTFEEASMLPILDKAKYSIAYFAPSNCFTFNSSSYQNVLLDGIDIITLKFKIKENAPVGEYNINIINDDSESRIITRYGVDDTFALEKPNVIFHPGKITVEKKSQTDIPVTDPAISQAPPATEEQFDIPKETVATSPVPKKYKFKKFF